jgi:hypothetical protein
MRPITVQLMVFLTSVFLVGFTLMPTSYRATERGPASTGPVLVACRVPSFGGVDRVLWWAWNPTQTTMYLASPEEGWGEVEGQHIVWSSEVEEIPEQAWNQLQGLVPIPALVPIASRQVAHGTFLADLPGLFPTLRGANEAPGTCAAPTAARLPLLMRCGWFTKPVSGRPTNVTSYQALVASQGLVISNPLGQINPGAPETLSATSAVPGSSDRL